MSTGQGCGHGHGCGRGRAIACAALNLEEEVPPTREQHVEESILEEPGVAQPGGEDAPPRGDDAPPPPLLFEVMDRQTHLMETLDEGLLCRNGGPPNDF